ncbi:DUF3945 domain-containing protein [uncultured Flavobacterium sp.]|uniref:DUF3945 domain-containing protein n=1 Tax=uncultured Flavobacterium sp. TaxID=165435 RepID=UPI0025981386|nr:DUF3945 domain-containing protein [uncultured Flavobacterium sp.]
MTQEIKFKDSHQIDLQLIPETVYNKKLTDEQRSRIATGRQSGLIKDIIVDEAKPPIDAKISAKVNSDGKVELTYDYAEKIFRMPTAILGMKLDKEQKDRLFNGELLAVKFKGDNLYVGIDRDLNKVTVKSAQQIGIPSEVSNYKLNDVDKYYLASGKSTDTHLFRTPEGDNFTANFSMTSDNKGISFSNIKFVDKENAKELAEKYNVDKKITDESFMLPPVRITQFINENAVAIETRPEVFIKKIVTSPLENKLQESIKNHNVIDPEILSGKSNLEKQSRRPIVEYKNVNTTSTGFSIEATEYFAPYKLKGVTLTEEQRKSIANGEKTLVKGMDIKNKLTDAYVQIKKDGSGFEMDFKSAQNHNKGFDKNISKLKGEDNKIER